MKFYRLQKAWKLLIQGDSETISKSPQDEWDKQVIDMERYLFCAHNKQGIWEHVPECFYPPKNEVGEALSHHQTEYCKTMREKFDSTAMCI